jgi:ribonuclease P protein component
VKKFSFPAAQRLKLKNDFKNVFKNGKKTAAGGIIFWYKLENQTGMPRLGIIVSKTLGNAPVRNRIKRFIREVFRLNKHKLANCDIILYPKKNTPFTDFENTQKVILKVFRSAGIIKND